MLSRINYTESKHKFHVFEPIPNNKNILVPGFFHATNAFFYNPFTDVTESENIFGHCKVTFKNSSVIRQKGKSESGCFKKIKHAKFSKKTNISIKGKKCLIFGKISVFCFLETPFFMLALLPYYRRIMNLGFVLTKIVLKAC